MLPIAFGVTWFGYGLASWGYCLLKGWNVPWSAWFSPLHPWDWSVNGTPSIPATQVNPSSDVKPVTSPAQAG